MFKLSYQLKAMIAGGSLGAIVAIFAAIVFVARVTPPTGGIDATHSQLTLISCGLCAFLMGWAALVFTRQLLAASKEEKKAASK
jgi:hypothetical protein